MGTMRILITVLMFGVLAACQSPEEQAAQADADMKKKRMAAVDEYNVCIEKAKGNTEQMDVCDRVLKSTQEALK
jgi:putative hemolysin